jgi:hypothetical protein
LNHFAITDLELKTRLRRRAWLWVVIGFILGCAAYDLVLHALVAREITDPAFEKACRYPKLEGEMTVVTILNDQLKCWVWR